MRCPQANSCTLGKIIKKLVALVVTPTFKQTYYLSEGIACEESDIELAKSKPIKLIVTCLSNSNVDLHDLIPSGKPFVLDIDLDYFSTRNPFKEMWKSAGFYTKLKDIYVFDFEGGEDETLIHRAMEACRKRKQLLVEMEDLTGFLYQGGQVWSLSQLPYSNRISPWLTEFGPLLWQAKQTVSALCQLQPAT